MELLERPTSEPQRSDAGIRHLRGAMYLAGYGVECYLKAYLIDSTSSVTLGRAVDALNTQRQRSGLPPVENIARTSAGHRIFYVQQLTNLSEFADYDPKLWGRVAAWSSSWRYETDPVRRQDAVSFLDDVKRVIDWIALKLS